MSFIIFNQCLHVHSTTLSTHVLHFISNCKCKSMLDFKLLATALVQKKPLLMLAHFLSKLKKLSSSSSDHHYYTVNRISILSMQKIL